MGIISRLRAEVKRKFFDFGETLFSQVDNTRFHGLLDVLCSSQQGTACHIRTGGAKNRSLHSKNKRLQIQPIGFILTVSIYF